MSEQREKHVPGAIQRRLIAIAEEAGDRHYDEATGLCLIPRDTLWYAAALLLNGSDESADRGNGILERIRSEDGTHTPASMLALLHAMPDRLTPPARKNLIANVERELTRAAMVEWHDGNVNHPVAAWCTLILGGELVEQSWAVEVGYGKLRAFQRTVGDRRHRHRRQAAFSEYNSLTYTALDLWFFALVAEYARHAGARRLGLFLEERLWIDVAMHFHAPSGQFAGPHSRSYQVDSSGGYSALHCTLAAASGKEIFFDHTLAERYNHPSDLVQNALIAIIPFHFPDEAREIAWRKPFPYYFTMTTYCESYHENSVRCEIEKGTRAGADESRFAFDDEIYPGGWSDLTTFMTREYALGSASTPYLNGGHSDGIVLRIRRSERVDSLRDFRSMYTRGVYNDARVGRKERCHVTGRTVDESYQYEEGRCAVYQHRNRAIVQYRPKRSGHRNLSSFRLDLIFTHAAPFDELYVDGITVERFPESFDRVRALVFRDAGTYGIIVPVPPVPCATENPIRLREESGHLIISFYNYEGTKRDFTRDEIESWRTGFYIEVDSRDDFETFDHFVSYTKGIDFFEDEEGPDRRSIRISDGNDSMEFVFDPSREKLIARRWNGVEERFDHFHVEAGGFPEGKFVPRTLYGSEMLPRRDDE